LEEQLINLITQVGIIPALFAYTLISFKKSLDNNTKAITELLVKLGGERSA
jgi:hypothetical protein